MWVKGKEDKMGDKYLSDVLSGLDIIEEKNQRICILSGVGSGKNTFVEKELSKYGNILYISSRRAKVNEILENKLCSDVIKWDKEVADVVAVTNYGVERIVQNKKFGRNVHEIINHFDFIVVDEAHSLFTDATFADSAFHVFAFIEYVISKYHRIKVVVMTGTPEPMERYLRDKGYAIFDKREECIHVLPKEIRIIDIESAFEYIEEMPQDEKTVYYSNSATRIVSGKKSLVNRLYEIGFSSEEIGICVSESSSQKLENEFEGMKEKCEKTKQVLLKNRTLDEKSRILLTTSCLKEGVNIENKNIRVAFCESHVLSEIRQFAGRIRNGLDVLFIISDAKQHIVSDEQLHKFYLELHYAVHTGRNNANEYIEKVIKNPNSGLFMEVGFYDIGEIDIAELFEGQLSLATMGGSLIPMYIERTESSNRYLKFNHLTGEFDVFANRYIEQRRINKVLKKYNWFKEIKQFSADNGILFTGEEPRDKVEIVKVIEYCNEKLDTIWIDENKKKIKQQLCNMMLLPSNSQLKTINSSFEQYKIPYRIKTTFTSKNKKNKRGISISKLS